MSFQPQVGDVLTIRGVDYKVAEHPAAPGIPYGQEGRQGIVYQLNPVDQSKHSLAIKVFRPKYRMPSLVKQSKSLKQFSQIKGLTVSDRFVLTTEEDHEFLTNHEDLLYSAVMPWVKGPTWADIIAEKRSLSQKESLESAKSLAKVLSQMEQEELAHCDLSAPNVMLPGLVQGNSQAFVELVDLEQMYSKKMEQPDVLPAGSPGYASHKSIKEGLWSPEADRFSGAILLIEMLSWSDEDIRENAWGDSYFKPNELQTNSERYERMLGSLGEKWGEEIVQLFMKAWKSEELDQCPTFGEWALKLNKIKLETEPAVGGSLGWNFKGRDYDLTEESPAEEAAPQFSVEEELAKAAELEQEGQLLKALDVYNLILRELDPSDAMAQELQVIIAELEKKLLIQNDAKLRAASTAKEAENRNAKVENAAPTPPESQPKPKPKKKKKRVPILLMTAVIVLAVGGVGYAFQEQIPFLNKLIGDEPAEVATKEVKEEPEETEEVKEEKTEPAKVEKEEAEVVSLWDLAVVGRSGEWQSNTDAKSIILNKGEKNNYISYDLTKLKVGKATVKGAISATEGIPFELAFFVDSEEVFKTGPITTGQSVPFEVPVNGGYVLTVKVLNNSIEGDDANKSTFALNEMVMEITSKEERPEPLHMESLWTTGIYSNRGEWFTSTDNHTVFVRRGVKNDYVSFDLSSLNIEEAMLTGVVVPTEGIPFNLEFYVDNELVYKTEEIDPSKTGPVPLNVAVKGKSLSIKLVNNSVTGDDNQKTTFELKDMLVNVHKELEVATEPSKESFWTKESTAKKGEWFTSTDNHTLFVRDGNNGDNITYDISNISLNNAKIKGTLIASGIPYQLQFKVDDQVVHTTRQISPDLEVPQSFEVPVSGKILTITVINNSVDGDDAKKTSVTIKDFLLETN
jgi:serine/threonine protein kinase